VFNPTVAAADNKDVSCKRKQ